MQEDESEVDDVIVQTRRKNKKTILKEESMTHSMSLLLWEYCTKGAKVLSMNRTLPKMLPS